MYPLSDLSVKRKIEKHRDKVLRCDNLLHKNPFVQPMASSIPKKFKKKHEKVLQANDAIEDRTEVRNLNIIVYD